MSSVTFGTDDFWSGQFYYELNEAKKYVKVNERIRIDRIPQSEGDNGRNAIV